MTLTFTPWLTGNRRREADAHGRDRGERRGRPADRIRGVQERTLEQANCLEVAIDVPIVGVSAPGSTSGSSRRRRRRRASGRVGPGQLRDVALTVTYNPDRPDDTTVSGTRELRGARPRGLAAQRRAAGSESASRWSRDGQLNAYGEIGVAGEASASIQVKWSPRPGSCSTRTVRSSSSPGSSSAWMPSSRSPSVSGDSRQTFTSTSGAGGFEFGSDLRFGLCYPFTTNHSSRSTFPSTRSSGPIRISNRRSCSAA